MWSVHMQRQDITWKWLFNVTGSLVISGVSTHAKTRYNMEMAISLWPTDMVPFRVMDAGQHLWIYWLVGWCNQVIIWSNVNISFVKFYGTHQKYFYQMLLLSAIRILFQIMFYHDNDLHQRQCANLFCDSLKCWSLFLAVLMIPPIFKFRRL